MEYVYIYRMTSDTGSAPCIFETGYNKTDVLTLACCKGGQIRQGKDVKTGLRHNIGKNHKGTDDTVYVVGIFKDCVLYVAKLSQIITMEDYFGKKQFEKRLDCIYTPKRKRNKTNPLFHPKGDGKQLRRDWNGIYVLLSEEFSYNGCKYEEHCADTIKNYLPKRQETKSYNNNSEGFETILSFIKLELKKKSSEKPICEIKEGCKGCNQR